jgi:hypothetical protein
VLDLPELLLHLDHFLLLEQAVVEVAERLPQ